MIWTKRWQRSGRESAALGDAAVELPTGFVDAIDAAVHSGWEAVDRLVDMLATIDAAGAAQLARSALSQLISGRRPSYGWMNTPGGSYGTRRGTRH